MAKYNRLYIFLNLNEDSILSLRVAVILVVDSKDGKGIILCDIEVSELLRFTGRSQQSVNINGTGFVGEVEVTIGVINNVGNDTSEDASIL